MSREMPKVPITVRSTARSGSFEVLTQALRPSGNVSRSSKPMIGCPVAMIRRSSQSACAACSSENASKSVLPTASSGLSKPSLRASCAETLTNRPSASLKYTWSGVLCRNTSSSRRSSNGSAA